MRTEMPKESENLVSCRKVGNQLKASYVIYADLELIVEKRQSCEGDPQKSYKVKTGRHSAYGYAYKVVKSNGEASETKFYQSQDAVEEFLKALLQES